MHESETKAERVARFYRLLDRTISQVALGHEPGPLRRQLEVAIMVSPITGIEQATALSQFDAAVELTDQVRKSLRT